MRASDLSQKVYFCYHSNLNLEIKLKRVHNLIVRNLAAKSKMSFLLDELVSI